MQITLTSVEMDKAVDLWLAEQGFSTDRYTKTTKIVAGRTDSGVGPRLEVTLDPLPLEVPSISEIRGDIQPTPRRFGHADE